MLSLLTPLQCHRPSLRIRVAGTNGKGSTASMLAAGLEAAGLRVGLYTSPHILSFHERIRVQGKAISDAALLTYLEHMMPLALEVGASYFEMATALALYSFSQAAVDVEILEAGVGAKLDATTAVDADMALITPIGLDHQAWLGNTLEEVAAEKAYALDACRWGITAPQVNSVWPILQRHHQDLQLAPAIQNDCAMLGEHQRINAALACSALQTLLQAGVIQGKKEQIIQAACNAQVAGRLQHIKHGEADIWLDAAHNEHAIEALLPSLPALAEPFDAILLYTREDRCLLNMLQPLRPYTRQIISDAGEVDCMEVNVEAALASILKRNSHAKLLVLGSFLTVAAAWQWLHSDS